METSPSQDPTSPPSDPVSRGRKRSAADARLPSRAAGSYQRAKASNACLVCRTRKTRCDNEWPVCGFCKSTGGECQYGTPKALRFDQASIAILKQLDHIEGLFKAQAELHHTLCVSNPEAYPDYAAPVRQGLRNDISDTATHNVEGGNESELSFQKRPFGSDVSPWPRDGNIYGAGHAPNANVRRMRSGDDIPPSSHVLSKAYSEMGIEAMLKWPVFEKRLSKLDISTEETLVELLGDTKPVGSLSTDSTGKVREEELDPLDGEKVQYLIENFLVNNNLKNPILDPAQLRKHGQDVVDSGWQWDGQSCLLLLVLAISRISTSLVDGNSNGQLSFRTIDTEFQEAELYFRASQRRIGSVYLENSLISTQCAFLTGVYLMYTLRIMAAWKSFVLAGTQCLSYLASRRRMNIHADGNRAREKLDIENTEGGDLASEQSSNLRGLEDGLYWSCLKSEVELRLEAGLPGSGINECHYPHVFPSPPSMDDQDPGFNGPGRGPPPRPATSFETDRAHLVTGWFFYLGEIALKRLVNRILLYRYGDGDDESGSPPSEDDKDSKLRQSAVEFDLQLEQWMRSLPPPMRFSSTSIEPLHDILRWVLRGHRIDIIELIRFPALYNILNSAPTVDTDSKFSHLHRSEISIRLAREYLENAVQRIGTNAEGFLHRHQGSWLTIRSCTRSALALLGTRLKYEEESNDRESASIIGNILPPGWRVAVLQVLGMLRAWEAESPDVRRLREILDGLLDLCPYD